MASFLLWYLSITILGIITFPIVYQLLPFLADKGYSLSRIAGLLIWSYFFWILTSLGILSNNNIGASIAFILLFCIAIISFRHVGWKEIKKWIMTENRTIIIIELLFLLSFGFWSIVRTANPEIQGTEKPMELAFINAISRSPSFPPNDPWLSGYAISYYYFGYIMVAILGYITGSLPAVSFNLAISAWFALTALGCYGIVLNLLRTWKEFSKSTIRKNERHPFIFSSLLGPFFVLIVSNLEGFLEMMHAKGFFWQKDQNGLLQSKFWSWLNIQELNQPPLMPYSFNPNRSGGIWWWRASRVLQDFDITGISKEVIDEFPFFSYFLGDLHPHVLAMPLGLLAISIGLNLFRGIKKYQQNTSFNKWIKEPILWFTILCCGGIAFTNTWDLPIYLGIISSVFLMIRIKGAGWSLLRIWETLKLILIIGILSILVYLPFFIGFSSQAGGILPSLNFFTPGKNFWIMFFPFLTILVFFLGWLLLHKENLKELPKTAIYCGICVSLLAIISYGFAWLIGNFSDIVLFIERITSRNGPPVFTSINSLVNLFIGVHGGMPINDVITTSLKNRISSPMTLLTLLFIGIICFSYFLSLFDKQGHKGKMSRIADESLGLFPIILLIFVGTIFCLIPEFFYLRDVFATRMNTIFKFYFQSWTIWGVAVAAAAIILWRQLREKSRVVFSFVLICAILTCCAYPFFGLIDKFKGIDLKDLTLDGSYYLFKYNNDEYNAIQWLRNTKYGNVAEAIGGSYSGYARIATYSGLPAVLGWPGHEMQWRGGVKEMESRESDIQLLYETDDWLKADEIIQKYQIRYIYVGDLEKSKYAVELNKFTEKLIKVYSNDTVLIYESNLE